VIRELALLLQSETSIHIRIHELKATSQGN